MTFITNNYGAISVNNTNLSLNQVAYNLLYGLARSADLNTIRLASTASTIDNIYNGYVIEIIKGAGKGNYRQMRVIKSYDGKTQTATIDTIWNILPNNTSKYIIHQNSGLIQGAESFFCTLKSTESNTDNIFTGCYMNIFEYKDFSISQRDYKLIKIINYDGTTKIANIDRAFITIPDSNYIYIIYGESGTCTHATNNTLILSDHHSSSVISGLMIEIYDGNGQGQIKEISNLTETVATISSNWKIIPKVGSRYVIFGGWGGVDFDNITQFSTISNFINFKFNEQTIAFINMLSLTDNGSQKEEHINILNQFTSDFNISTTTNFYGLKLIGLGTKVGGLPDNKYGIQTVYRISQSNSSNFRYDSSVIDSTNTILSRSVLFGKNDAGVYKNINIDHNDSLNVNIKNTKTAFGDILVSKLIPIVQIQFLYKLFKSQLNLYKGNSGNIQLLNNSMVELSTGTTPESMASLQSKNIIKYNAGQGIDIRYTTIFSKGVNNTKQYVGIGDMENGFFFGYHGEDFGIITIKGGRYEIRSYSPNKGCLNNGNISIILNGKTPVIIPVTKKLETSPAQVAKKIAEADYSQTGFSCFWYGDKVYFTSLKTGVHDGVYSINVNSTGIRPRGDDVIIQEREGVLSSINFVNQNKWNLDKANGYGILPNLNHLLGNVYRIVYQWLGFGLITFYIEHQASGEFIPVHSIKYSNTNISPSILQPSNRLSAFVFKDNVTDNIKLSASSIAGFSQGKIRYLGPRFSISHRGTIKIKEEILVVIRVKNIINNIINKANIIIDGITVACVNIDKACQFNLTINPIIKNHSPNKILKFISADEDDDSIVEYVTFGVDDIFAIEKGRQIFTTIVGPNNAFTRSFDKDQEIILYPQDILVVSAQINYDNIPGTISGSRPNGKNKEGIYGLAQFGCSWIENI